MHNLSQDEKRNKSLRLSDASTADLDFSGDEEFDCSQPAFALYSTFQAKSLFEQPEGEWEEFYSELNKELEEIFAQLVVEIEPVDLRECKCFLSNSVNLNTVLNSKLCRRRATMPPKFVDTL